MTPDLQREFRSLADQAKQQLKCVAESGSYRHVFSFWSMPSFAPFWRCTVYEPLHFVEGRLPFAGFSIWRNDLDLKKLSTPAERLKYPKDLAPTFESDNLCLDRSEIEQIEQRIRGISIPFYLGRPNWAGTDGTRFEFQYDGFVYGATIGWWENHPEEWRPFTETIVQIMVDFENRRKTKKESGCETCG